MEGELIKKSKQIPPYCDNKRESFKQKVEEMYNGSHSYSVTYTELVKRERTMTKEEINKLLINPCVKSINIIKEMKHQFKPFDQVLVRDRSTGIWHADLYSHYDHDNSRHQCVSSFWDQCIPYNENTAHLVGTNDPYKEPEPKVWRVSSHGDTPENLTNEELSHFIRNAVILNKDITDVHIRYIGQ